MKKRTLKELYQLLLQKIEKSYMSEGICRQMYGIDEISVEEHNSLQEHFLKQFPKTTIRRMWWLMSISSISGDKYTHWWKRSRKTIRVRFIKNIIKNLEK